MTTPDAWATALRQAAEQLGHPVPAIPRTVAGITGALSEQRRDEFRAELDAIADGISFEVLLDTWWTQAVVDSAEGEDARERALEVADLAVSLRNRSDYPLA